MRTTGDNCSSRNSYVMTADTSILFVFGAARSGTTYVNRLLEEWFDFGMGPEGTFIMEFERRLPAYGELSVPANIERLVADVCRHETFEIPRSVYHQEERFDVTPEMVLSRLREPSFADVVRASLECMAVLQGKSRLGNKYSGYWQHLPRLERLFDAKVKYLCVVRDGRDVALSTMKMPWGEHSEYCCAKSWVKIDAAVRSFREQVADRLLVLHCESLLLEPDDTIRTLEAFLGTELDENRRCAMVQELTDSAVHHPTQKWKKTMSSRGLRRYEAVAGATIERLGYEPVLDNPRVNLLERGFFETQEWLRKLRRVFV